MWTNDSSDRYLRKHKKYEKKQPRELEAVLKNVSTYQRALSEGTNPLQIKFKFVHDEGRGVYAIDQSGGGKSLAQCRLYVFPDVINKVLWLLTIGDKRTQKQDIQDCRDMIVDFPNTHEENDDSDDRKTETDQASEAG